MLKYFQGSGFGGGAEEGEEVRKIIKGNWRLSDQGDWKPGVVIN